MPRGLRATLTEGLVAQAGPGVLGGRADQCSRMLPFAQMSFCTLMNTTFSVLDEACANKTIAVSLEVTMASL